MTPIDLVTELLAVGQRWQQLGRRLCSAPSSPVPLAVMGELLIDPLARLANVVDPLASWPPSAPRPTEGVGQRSRAPGVTPLAARSHAGAASHLSPVMTWATDRRDTQSFMQMEPSPDPTPTVPVAVPDDPPQGVRLTSSHTALRALLQANVEPTAAPEAGRVTAGQQVSNANHAGAFQPSFQPMVADSNAAEATIPTGDSSSSQRSHPGGSRRSRRSPQMRTLPGWTGSASSDADYTRAFSELGIPTAEMGNLLSAHLAQPTDWSGDELALHPSAFQPAAVATAGSGTASPFVQPVGDEAAPTTNDIPGAYDRRTWPWEQGVPGGELSAAVHFQRDEMAGSLLTDAQVEQVLAALTERLELTLLRAYGATG